MKTQPQRAALAADVLVRASLRVGVTTAGEAVQVDEAAGVIRGAACMQIGPAQGHGFSIDAQTLKEVEALGNAHPGGVKVRYQHPKITDDGMMPDDLGAVIGYVDNLRVVGEVLRGDVHLEDYAEVVPGLGDVKTYLLRRAKSHPEKFGLSCVIGFAAEEQRDAGGNVVAIVARVGELEAIDVVGRGAATPNGLLSAVTNTNQQGDQTNVNNSPAAATANAGAAGITKKGSFAMNEKMKQHLIAHFGLAAGATDEDAQKMFDGMTPEQQEEVKSKSAQMAAKNNDSANIAALAMQTEKAMLAAEGERVAMLQQLGTTLTVDPSVVSLAIAEGDNVTKARARYLKHLQEKCKPIAGLAGATVIVGEDKNVASLAAALPHAIMLRGDVKVEKPHERSAQLRQLTLIDMGRHFFAALGFTDVWSLSRTKMAEVLLNRNERTRHLGDRYAMLAQSTGNFDNILADTIGKSLRQAYLDAPSTWQIWARRATAPDFKTISRTAISESPNLVSRKEGGEVKYVTLSDSKETYTLAEYVSGIKLTRQAIINDDMDAFSRIPTLQANAAKRKEDDVCYAILTANAALNDSVALFHATHANLGTAGVISITTLAEARKQMRVQKGPKSAAILNLRPKYLLVPAALEAVAEQYTSSQFVAATSATINPFANGNRSALTPVVEPRLDDSSATAWYTAADNTQIDTVEVCFLMDEPEPVLKEEVEFDTDDRKYAVRHTVSAKAIDFRGMTKNAGA